MLSPFSVVSRNPKGIMRLAPYVVTEPTDPHSGFRYFCRVHGYMEDGTTMEKVDELNVALQTLLTQGRVDLGSRSVRLRMVAFKEECDIQSMDALLLDSVKNSVKTVLRTKLRSWEVMVYSMSIPVGRSYPWWTKKNDPEMGWGSEECYWWYPFRRDNETFDIESTLISPTNKSQEELEPMKMAITQTIMSIVMRIQEIDQVLHPDDEEPLRLHPSDKGSALRLSCFSLVCLALDEIIKDRQYPNCVMEGFGTKELYEDAVQTRNRWERGELVLSNVFRSPIKTGWITDYGTLVGDVSTLPILTTKRRA